MTADAGEADSPPAAEPDDRDPEPAPGPATEDLEPAVTEAGDGDSAGIDPEEIDVASLTGPVRSLDPRVRLVWIAQSLLTAVVLGAVVSVGSALTFGPAWPGGVVTAVLATAGSVHALLRYRRWSYQVQADSLVLERGVFTEVTTVVPYVRIQHVDASRGPVERLAGLATTVVYTAGTRGADVSVPGLTPEDAEGLQRRLKRLAIAAEGDDAV